MAKMEVRFDDYAKALERLQTGSNDLIGGVVYKGAKVMADGLRAAIDKIPVVEEDDEGNPIKDSKGKIKGISKTQQEDLKRGFGISPDEKSAYGKNVKVGFGGYGRVKTKKHPRGIPNGMLAQVITNGNSFRRKTPILRTTQQRLKKPTLLAMEQEAEKIIKEKMGE